MRQIGDDLTQELRKRPLNLPASGPILDRSVGIKCIGVWDTVDAVGVPLDELRPFFNGVSTKVFKRRLYGFDDQQLDQRVRFGFQALAIDDERRTFHPNIWEARRGIEQVWFAGVHSNVGGGYPKDGLSHVPLDWMMGQVERCGIRFDTGARAQVQEEADEHGKLYDSRAGLGVFYRYAPRDLRRLSTSAAPRQGAMPYLLRIHTSVYKRIARGTARYAPLGIPPLGIDSGLETRSAQTDTGPFISPPTTVGGLMAQDRVNTDKLIAARSNLYWFFVASVLYLSVIAVFALMNPEAVAREPRWPGLISSVLKGMLPVFLEPIIDLAGRHPLITTALALFFVAMRRASTTLASDISKTAFTIWNVALGRSGPTPDLTVTPWSPLQWMRRGFDAALRFVRPALTLLPKGFSLTAIVGLLVLMLIDFQPYLSPSPSPLGNEPQTTLSSALPQAKPGGLAVTGVVETSIRAALAENSTGIILAKGGQYGARYVGRVNWTDAGIEPGLGGFSFGRNLWGLGLPRFLWLTPLRPRPFGAWFEIVGQIKGTPEMFSVIDSEDPDQFKPFTAASVGELLLFVNDVPYGNNSGVMTLQVRRTK